MNKYHAVKISGKLIEWIGEIIYARSLQEAEKVARQRGYKFDEVRHYSKKL